MSRTFVLIFSLYMIYTNIKMLLSVPFSEWKLEQYLLVVVTIGFVVVAGYFTRLIIKNKKSKTEQ